MQVYECVVARPDHLYCVSICFFIFLSVLLIGEIILSRTPPASEHTQWQKISHSLTGSKEQCWQYVRQQAVAAVVAMVTPVTIVNMGCLGQKKSFMNEDGYVCFLHGKAQVLLWNQLALFWVAQLITFQAIWSTNSWSPQVSLSWSMAFSDVRHSPTPQA